MQLEQLIADNFAGNQYLTDVLNNVKNISCAHKVYNMDFATRTAKLALANNLDDKCLAVAMVYPFVIGSNADASQLIDNESKTILDALIVLYNIKVNNKHEEIQAIRSLFLSTAKDLRTMILKLCIEVAKIDSLYNFDEQEQQEIIYNYNNFYSPIASMLGLTKIKDALEDVILKYNMPELYSKLTEAVQTCVADGQQIINSTIDKIVREFKPQISNIKVFGRQKKIYSIAKKLLRKSMSVSDIIDTYNGSVIEDAKQKEFSATRLYQIVDVLALMILVNNVDECYAVLGKIFTMFTPLGNFKDYISHPKPNGYQSIHCVVLINDTIPLEIQIRTFDMHEYNEYGLASHWAYKNNTKVDKDDLRINYMRKLMKSFEQEHNDSEIMQLMLQDMYSDNIFVQSPMGKVIRLPEFATPIDFAYNIHSGIGNQCVGAKVNGKIVPLNTALNNGDVVEIITNANAKGPSRDWLKIVKTNSAKKKIRDFFKHEMKDENIKRGKSMLDAQAKILNINLNELLVEPYLQPLFDKYGLTSIDDMYSSVGYGRLKSTQIIYKLKSLYDENNTEHAPVIKAHRKIEYSSGVNVKGQQGLMVKYCKNCNPLPGDAIIGFVSRAAGITIHRTNCYNITQCDIDRLIECSWNEDTNQKLIGSITIITENKTGVLSNISKKINDMQINIMGISSKNNADNTSTIYLQVEVSSREQLNELITKLNNFSFVLDIFRA